MARKRRGGRRGFRVGKWVNLAFKLIGLGVAASPAIKGVQENLSNPGNIPAGVAYNYSGVDITTGGFSSSQAAQGVGAVLIGVLLAKLGGFLGRRF